MTARWRPLLVLMTLVAGILACNMPMPESAPPAVEATLPPAPEDTPMPTNTAGPLDCGQDMDCFIQAARNCAPASVEHVTSLNLFGAVVSSYSALRLLGFEGDRCRFSIKTERVKVEYPEEVVQQMLDQGLSEDEIEQQRQMAEDQAQQTGYNDTCLFEPQGLVAMLERWQRGSYSTEDWQDAECEGKVFGQGEGE